MRAPCLPFSTPATARRCCSSTTGRPTRPPRGWRRYRRRAGRRGSRSLSLQPNGGKAEAVRQGMRRRSRAGPGAGRLPGRRSVDAAGRAVPAAGGVRPARRRGGPGRARGAARDRHRAERGAPLPGARLRQPGGGDPARARLRHPVRGQAVSRLAGARRRRWRRRSSRAGRSTSSSWAGCWRAARQFPALPLSAHRRGAAADLARRQGIQARPGGDGADPRRARADRRRPGRAPPATREPAVVDRKARSPSG